MFEGTTWKTIVDEIIATLPEKIYLSFDIDGLDPKLCPNTGTPVPGGFEVEQILYLFRKVKEAGKMRVEGKNYTVKDGDVMHFLFNV